MSGPHNDTNEPAKLPARPLGRHEVIFQTLAAVFIGLLCATITLSVLSRWLWRSIVPDEVQWVQLMMIVIILGPLAATMAMRETIAVEIFTARARGGVLKAVTLLGHLVGLIFLTFLLWAGVRLLKGSWASGEYFKGVVDIPNWIGHSIFVFCLSVAWLRLAAMVVLDLRRQVPGPSANT